MMPIAIRQDPIRCLRRPVLAALVAAAMVLAPGDADALNPAQEEALGAVNAYLNAITHLEGDFTQIAPDGEVSEGRFFIRRPGRARFDYAEPNRLLVIADGFWIGVVDRKLNTTDRYPIGSTPYWALLKEEVDLRTDARVLEIERDGGLIVVSIDDPSGEAAGELTLIFEETGSDGTGGELKLNQWLITDAQGLTTSVMVYNLVAGRPARNRLFTLHEFD